MRKALFIVSLLLLQVGFLAYTVSAADCSGSYKVYPDYQPGYGGPCKMLGLDAHKGVCRPGYSHETLCDDTSGGRYRTCQGSVKCGGGGNNNNVAPNTGCNWDFNTGKACPSGYFNYDCSGGCGKIH